MVTHAVIVAKTIADLLVLEVVKVHAMAFVKVHARGIAHKDVQQDAEIHVTQVVHIDVLDNVPDVVSDVRMIVAVLATTHVAVHRDSRYE